jgi:hypothetical protein
MLKCDKRLHAYCINKMLKCDKRLHSRKVVEYWLTPVLLQDPVVGSILYISKIYFNYAYLLWLNFIRQRKKNPKAVLIFIAEAFANYSRNYTWPALCVWHFKGHCLFWWMWTTYFQIYSLNFLLISQSINSIKDNYLMTRWPQCQRFSINN